MPGTRMPVPHKSPTPLPNPSPSESIVENCHHRRFRQNTNRSSNGHHQRRLRQSLRQASTALQKESLLLPRLWPPVPAPPRPVQKKKKNDLGKMSEMSSAEVPLPLDSTQRLRSQEDGRSQRHRFVIGLFCQNCLQRASRSPWVSVRFRGISLPCGAPSHVDPNPNSLRHRAPSRSHIAIAFLRPWS